MQISTISYQRLNGKWIPKATIFNTNDAGKPMYDQKELLEEEYDTKTQADVRILKYIDQNP